LHGGANEEVLIMLREIGDKSNAISYLEKKIAKKEKIMGFGHREYKVKDPRASILQKVSKKLFDQVGKSPLYEIAEETERAAEKLLSNKGLYSNVDFYSGIIYDKMGIESDFFTPLFAMGRVSGWLAHWLEQVKDNHIFRPTEIYEGERNINYLPVSKRG
jgi:citrate synthase